MSDVTAILSQIESGDRHAAEKLLPLVYDELRKLAAVKLAHEKPGQTLQATALVHEAYIRLVGGDDNQQWDSRGHFFAAAAEAMRRIIVDQARHKATIRAGGQNQRIELSEVEPAIEGPTLDLMALDEALKRLEHKDPRKAELIKLRFFLRVCRTSRRQKFLALLPQLQIWTGLTRGLGCTSRCRAAAALIANPAPTRKISAGVG